MGVGVGVGFGSAEFIGSGVAVPSTLLTPPEPLIEGDGLTAGSEPLFLRLDATRTTTAIIMISRTTIPTIC